MKRTLFILLVLFSSIQILSAQCYCEDCPEPIIFGAPSTASLNVAGSTNNILGMNGQSLINVGVEFTHDAAQELSLRLVAPDGSFVDLTIGEGLDAGLNNIFDIDFVQCSGVALPDCTNNSTWDSNDEWDGGPYTGSYFPEIGCLEDLTGDVNGTWTLELEDVFAIFDGELFCFDLTFADGSGISCNSSFCDNIACLAQGGNIMTPSIVLAPVGDPSLIIDFNIEYENCEFPPSGPEYVFVYVISEIFPGTIVEIVEGQVDMTAYPEGSYTVQGLSILASDLPTILALDFSTTTIFDLSQFILNEPICADYTSTSAFVTIDGCILPLVNLPFDMITAPEGDPALDPDWLSTITYTPNNPPNPATFGFYFVVYDAITNVLIGYFTTDDFTSLPEGNYNVQYLVYALSDASLLPTINGNNTFADLLMLLNNDVICGVVSGANSLVVEDDCPANAGVLPISTIDECIGDPSLNLDLTPSYPSGGQPNAQFSYTYVISENGVITSYSMSTDFTSFPAGEYEICGLSYLTSDEPLIPSVDGSYSLGDLQNDIDSEVFCGDVTDDCQTILISEIPDPIFTGPTEVCAGVLVQYEVENFNGDISDYLFFIQSGGFSDLNNNGDGTFDIAWTSGPAVICLTEFNNGCSEKICLTVNINPEPEITIIGSVIVCPGDELIYTFDPAPVGPEFYDVLVTGGTITSQTANTVTILWDDSAVGSILATLLGGACDSEPTLLEVDKVEVEFPMLPIPTASCISVGFGISDIDDPLIIDWEWTATNADIFIQNGFVNFTWQGIGLAEICLEITTVCGTEEMCFDVDVLEAPEPFIAADLEFCSLTFTLDAIPSIGNSWLWTSPGSGGTVSYSDQTNPTTEVTVTGPGTYTFILQEFGVNCSGTVETEVTITDGLSTGTPFVFCDGLGNYIVSFDITSGTLPFTVDGVPISGNSYSSTNFISGDAYSFLVEDSEGCAALVEGDFTCPCISDAGTMSSNPITLCISDDIDGQGIYNDDATLDSDDIGLYVLHTGDNSILGVVLSINSTGEFLFDDASMIAGQVYYISYIVGNELAGSIDLLDPCLSVAVGQPIIFYADPVVDAGVDNSSCELIYNLSINAITTSGTWSIVSEPSGGNADLQIVSGETFVTVNVTGDYVFELEANENGCTGIDEITITFLDSPTVENVSTECDGDFYTVSFDVTGGTEPYFINGNEILDGTFTSVPIMSGANYGFTVIDAEGCASEFIQGTTVCNCTTEAGTMDQEEITICAVDGESIVGIFNNDATFDGDDAGVFILHTGSSNILGTVLDTNDVAEFLYDDSYGSGVTLYLSYVVADDLGAGAIDFDDDCLSVSVGQPVNIEPLLKVDAGDYIDQCSFAFDLNADDQGVSGAWFVVESPTNANITFSNELDAESSFEADIPGVYSISWQPSGALCVIGDTATFTLDTILNVESILTTCAEDLQTYIVTIEISGGESPYFLDGIEVANTFDLLPLDSGDPYSITVTDNRGCELLIEGTANCDCSNLAGSMGLDTLRGCIGDTLIATYNNDAVLDSNDVAFFVLHTVSEDSLGAVFAISTEPIVVYLPILIVGNVYYLSHVIGNQSGPGLDFNDPCLQISIGQPILFDDPPSVSAGDDQEICGLTTFLSGSSSESTTTWAVIQTPFGASTNIDENDPESEFSVTVSGEYILEIEANNGFCSEFDTVTITFLESIFYEDLSVNCTVDGYTVSFNVFGGSGSYFVDGASLTGNSFESELIPAGEDFTFTLMDDGDCPSIEVNGLDTCECENDAGTMSDELIILCIDDFVDINELNNNDVILDDNDIRYHVIHTSSSNELGDVLAFFDYDEGVQELIFTDAPFEIGVIYYISTVLANMGVLDGDVNDPCLKVALGTPIVWRDYDEISFNDDLEACVGDIINIDLTASGAFPFEITVMDNLGYSEVLLIDEESFSFEYVVIDDAILSLDFGIDEVCFTIGDSELFISIEELEVAEVQSEITICNSEEFGSVVFLEDLITSGNTDGVWIFNENEIQGTFDVNGFVEGEYRLEYVIESVSCSDSETYEVLVKVEDCDCPIFDFASENVTCFGDQDGSISILISDGLEITDFIVFLNEEEIESNTEIVDLASGNYSLELSDGDDCIVSFVIMISEPAPVQISLGEDMEVEIDDPVIIEAITNLIDQEIDGITWQSLSGILEDNDLLLNTSFRSDDIISINIIDENGCSGSDDIMVRVTVSDFIIPNVINTNSTVGNDVFKIHNTEGVDEIVSLSIYDRWGNVVHRVQNVLPDSEQAQWDGSFGGKPLNPGVYVYRIVLSVQGEEEVVFGDLTVL